MWFVSLSLVSCFRAPVVPPAPLVPPVTSGVGELEATDGPDGVRLAERTVWNGAPLTLRYQPLVRRLRLHARPEGSNQGAYVEAKHKRR